MKLVQNDGTDFRIADEALLVRPIRELFRQDKTKKKEEFWKQMSYLWFMCDPRSSYQYLTDETDRSIEVKRQEGFGLDWKPNRLLQEAMDIYKRQSITTASLLIDDMRYALDSIRVLIRRIARSLNDSKEEDKNVLDLKLDRALDSLTKAADKIPDLAKKLVEAEKALAKDFASEDSTRGGIQKAIGEDV